MKSTAVIFLGLAVASAACQPSETAIQTAIAQTAAVVPTRQALVQTAIAETEAAAPTTQALVQTAIIETQGSWTPTRRPAQTSVSVPSCYQPAQITPSLEGQEVCVRGVVSSWKDARYRFTDEPGSFFLYWPLSMSGISDPATGKALSLGTCIENEGEVQVNSGVPYMDLRDQVKSTTFEGLIIYTDPEACR